MTRLSPPRSIEMAARVKKSRTRKTGRPSPGNRERSRLSAQRAQPENVPLRNSGGRNPLTDEQRSSLKARLKFKRKYARAKLSDFSKWQNIQEKFLYDHNLIYREDRDLRNRFMSHISDTANCYMRIRRALGLREYNWVDNPHLFLNMGLSKELFRKAVKRLVNDALSSPDLYGEACWKPRMITIGRLFSKQAVD